MRSSHFGASALVAAAGLLSLPALAQENGATDRSNVPRSAAVAPAGPITAGGPWNEFSFAGPGSNAKGCAPADPGGAGCAPSSAGNSQFVGAPPWTFTAPSDGATLTVTDAFLGGDTSPGVRQRHRSAVHRGTDCRKLWQRSCALSGRYVAKSRCLQPGVSGAHSITIKMLASPFNSGAAVLPDRQQARTFRLLPDHGSPGPAQGRGDGGSVRKGEAFASASPS